MKKNTILLVQGSKVQRNTVKQSLISQGFTVITAENGFEGMAKYEEYVDVLDLIITDLEMPLMGGYEFTLLIKGLYKVPVVILIDNKESVTDCGADGYILKDKHLRNNTIKKINIILNTSKKGRNNTPCSWD